MQRGLPLSKEEMQWLREQSKRLGAKDDLRTRTMRPANLSALFAFLLGVGGFIGLLSSAPSAATSTVPAHAWDPTVTAYSLIVIGVAVALWFVHRRVTPAQEPQELTKEESLFRQLIPVFESIDYFQTDRAPAAQAQIIRRIGKPAGSLNWDESEETLQLVSKEVQQYLNQFVGNFRKRLLPSLSASDVPTFDLAVNCLIDFAHYLLDPSIPKLHALNANFERLPEKEEVRKKSNRHEIEIGAAFIGVGILVGLVIYFIGVEVGASIDYRYATAVGVFGVIVGVYLLRFNPSR